VYKITQLDDVRTFLLRVCTASTPKHVVEHGNNVHTIIDVTKQKLLVKQGELIGTDNNVYTKRYKILSSQPTEALLTTTINNLIDGINKLNLRQAIASYTRPSTLIWMELVSVNEGKVNFKNSNWDNQIILDVSYTTS